MSETIGTWQVTYNPEKIHHFVHFNKVLGSCGASVTARGCWWSVATAPGEPRKTGLARSLAAAKQIVEAGCRCE